VPDYSNGSNDHRGGGAYNQRKKGYSVPRATIFSVILLLFCSIQMAPAQQPNLPPVVPPSAQQGTGTSDLPPDMQKRMGKDANKQRQQELKRDTDKLLKLSTELKDYVDKTNENILSMDVIKKADEIEKLAHSVKIKMRGDNLSPAVAGPQ
jgi:hypothetical protein